MPPRSKAELDEAQQLREEAQGLLADVKAQREDAERQASSMLEAAKADAKRLAEDAKEKARRADQAPGRNGPNARSLRLRRKPPPT